MLGFWQQKFSDWLDQRTPAADTHFLMRKNLYIFPSKRGFIFLMIIAVLWLIGTNYQNNLILGLSFLLLSLFLVTILHTYMNLAGLELHYKGVKPSYVGDEIFFRFDLCNSKKNATENLEIAWQSSLQDSVLTVVEEKAIASVMVPILSSKRGCLRPGRMLVQSYYPLGLFRCWTWLNWHAIAVVYPSPKEVLLSPSTVSGDDGDGTHPTKGGDDFNALNEYRPGDSIKHIAWKTFARDQGLYTKEFSQNVSRELWLDFDAVESADTETKLSALCFWVNKYYQLDENYGLVMPGVRLEPNKGENHRAEILERLALFGLPDLRPQAKPKHQPQKTAREGSDRHVKS